MKIVVTAAGADLDALASPVFGRCPAYIFVDTETLAVEARPNPAINAGGGAGIQAAQYVIGQGAQAVLTGNVGPNAFDVFRAAGVPVYLIREGTVRQAVEDFRAGRLQPVEDANVAAHAGMGAGLGRGRGMASAPPIQPEPSVAREAELAQLRETLQSLRQQLAQTVDRIEQLEKEK